MKAREKEQQLQEAAAEVTQTNAPVAAETAPAAEAPPVETQQAASSIAQKTKPAKKAWVSKLSAEPVQETKLTSSIFSNPTAQLKTPEPT